nr:MAG TPA: hypothetical protein [Caudoviricetes sp.]
MKKFLRISKNFFDFEKFFCYNIFVKKIRIKKFVSDKIFKI